MESKFAGRCRECGGPIRKGESIDYDKEKGGAAHAMCAQMEPGNEFRETVSDAVKPVELAERLGFK